MENQARDYGQENFTLPHDMVPLPSQGAFYKNKKKEGVDIQGHINIPGHIVKEH